MNKVYLMGRLAADPEVRVTQSGKKVCNFALAISMGKDKPAQFHDCVAWDNTAEFLGRYTHKGNRILVEGRLDKSAYEKDGQKRYITSVIADRVEFADGANQPQNGATSMPTQTAPKTAQNQPSVAFPFTAQEVEMMNNGISEDDLPF